MLTLFGVGVAVATFIISLSKRDESLSGISVNNIYETKRVWYNKNSNPKIVKQKITRNANIIINSCNYFKIGKSGNLKGRAGNYKGYDAMIILCRSKHKNLIEELEAYYNHMYITNPKNENKKEGSAGVMSDKEGTYYLYISVDKLPKHKIKK